MSNGISNQKNISELKQEIGKLLLTQKCFTKNLVCRWIGLSDESLREMVLVAIECMVIDGELHSWTDHGTDYVYLTTPGKKLYRKCRE
jgi:hypothetical protein